MKIKNINSNTEFHFLWLNKCRFLWSHKKTEIWNPFWFVPISLWTVSPSSDPSTITKIRALTFSQLVPSMIQANHHPVITKHHHVITKHHHVKQKKKKVRKGKSLHKKIQYWDCNGLKLQVSVGEISASDLELILTNFMQWKHDSSIALSGVALQSADVLLLRSTVLGFRKQSIVLAEALMELNNVSFLQLLASTTSALAGSGLVTTWPHLGSL